MPGRKWYWRIKHNFLPNLIQLRDKPANVLEIGVFAGDTSRWLLENILKHPDSKLIGIDPWVKEYFTRRDIQGGWDNIIKSVDSVVADFGNKVQMIKGFASDILKRKELQETRFDFIYIDGDHTYNSVMNDFILSWPLLKTSGVLIFDDYLIRNRKTNKYDMQMQYAIDKILFDYQNEIELIFKNRQVGIRKVA